MAGHTCYFFTRAVAWCGKIYSTDGIRYLPKRIERLDDTRSPEWGGTDAVHPCRKLDANIVGEACNCSEATA